MAQADPTRYPDPRYTALREALARLHGVDSDRIALAGSASEFIFRITALAARDGATSVSVPVHAYGDYTHAAQSWGLQTLMQAAAPSAPYLMWACEPSSPLGQAHTAWPDWLLNDELPATATPPALCPAVVLDCAYAPLRLSGNPGLTAAQRARVWQLWSPNKSLGLTGLRAAYAIAPEGAQSQVQRLDALAPSWPIGAHGEAMLLAWAAAAAQTWLADSLQTLRDWKAAQVRMLQSCGWECAPSDANFFCARPPRAFDFAALRPQGIKLRDASSFGLPGWARLSVQSPHAQAALRQALHPTGAVHTAAHSTQPQGTPKV